MPRTHLYSSHISVGHPISPFSHSYVADMNRQNSPTILEAEQGSITRSVSVTSDYNSICSQCIDTE